MKLIILNYLLNLKKGRFIRIINIEKPSIDNVLDEFDKLVSRIFNHQ